ncbi:TIR domain-containing protein [Frankia sp. AvcI1]|uniref:toll/interleukin-1 receptor domain-containing protein n=1 Tax=Frankia sp. AvcI1 TaxID=573496 RepID=UPI0021187C25|nr:TIR domain-containing protein [Frankia sp. AvcI1]
MRTALGSMNPTIFINYRTGDGEKTAQIIDTALSARFGSEHIVLAPKSIQPGENFVEGLLSRVSAASAMVPVVGSTWADSPKLRDPNDWVRREILLAMQRGIWIVPVLDNRLVERLDPDRLPPELARFAEFQSIRLDPQTLEARLRDLGDLLTRHVPGLRDLDQEKPGREQADPAWTAARGDAWENNTVQGNIVRTIKGGPGPINLGTMYTGPSHHVTDHSQHTDHSYRVDNSHHVAGDYHDVSGGGVVNTGDIHGAGSIGGSGNVHNAGGGRPELQPDPTERRDEESR